MRRQLLLSFLLLLVMLVVMRWQGASLITEVTPHGIVDIEFAKTILNLVKIQEVWKASDFKTNIYFDFLFIITYTWFFYIACLFIKFRTSWKPYVKTFILFSLAAGILDIFENVFMLIGWYNNDTSFYLEAAYYCALVKFILIGSVVLFLIAGFLMGYLPKRYARRRSQL